ncbi:peptidase s41 family protein [Gigaspora margarita]|uniref:Peptidase s41 family protein n=1 Tax=Gigaspora margarita TaxID=4874 RepID=A0A8H4AUJ9_GIGMA|nr:peptidase s41 family protein [Gigaspora margarita]
MKIIQVYSTLNIYLVLFVALLTDAKLQCEEVSKSLESNEPVEYNVAKKCLESFPYNARHATETVDSVLHFLSNYYVFLDRAKDNPPSGFKYQPVDLKTELISLHGFKKYSFKLKDGHTRVTNLCYQNFIYDQNLALYSVITTDKVGKKDQVFNDTLDPSNNDCEITEIGGKPALKAIIDFANDKIAYSKDQGVRFNMALALSINSFSQQFNLRGDFPETSNITYNLSCSKNKSFTLERKWNITYKNGFGLFNNFCMNQNNNTIFSPNDNFASSDKDTESTLATESISSDKFEPPESSNENKKIAHAKLVVEDFYLLDDGKTKVGVAVITRERQDHDNILKDGFQELNKRDMSNNIGGALTVPLFLTSLLFSSKQPNSFPTDITIQNFTIPKIEKNLIQVVLINASEFIGSRKKRTSNLYLNALTSNEEKILNNTNTSSFPWIGDYIIIITNGFCASSCALLTLFFSEIHKVKTIAVGGLLDTQMSFSTFPGGEVQSLMLFHYFLVIISLMFRE